MKKQIISEEFKRMQKLAGLITENQFYGDYDEDSVKQMLIDAGKDPQEVDDFMNDEEGYFSWSNMTFDHQPTDEDIKNTFVDAFEEWATGGTNSLSAKDINLLQFVKQNKDEIAEKIGAVRLENIMIDDLGDVGATGIYVDETDDTGEEMEGGLAFRFPEDVDDDFVGENGDEPNSINVAGEELMYVGYNI